MDNVIHFSCVECGQCCHDLRLPLGVDEAIGWLRDGGRVQAFCEAIPWPEEPPPGNLQADHKRRRSFAAFSGTLPVRVVVTLVAAFAGPCPNLQADMRCGIYATRPRVCRIYPAEVNPFIRLVPAGKACPPQAWSTEHPVLMNGAGIADAALRRSIEAAREADREDVRAKAALCRQLGIATTALSNEGFVIYSLDRDAALDALSAARAATAAGDAPRDDDMPPWRFVTRRAATRTALDEVGACVVADGAALPEHIAFLAFDAAG